VSKTILHIEVSPLGERSVSRKLTTKILAGLQAKYPGSTAVTRDLAAAPLPHLDGLTIGAFFTPADQRSPVLAEAIKNSDAAVAEVLAADIIVIGAPMWNFGLPSGLKAWIDHIVRAGLTFRYTENGPVGLAGAGKKVIVASARGGVYTQGPTQSFDHQETYLQLILGFIGFTDVTFVRAEGLAMGEEAVAAAMQSADAKLAETLLAA
jgi:FMN-dependent NADH-azoreductase